MKRLNAFSVLELLLAIAIVSILALLATSVGSSLQTKAEASKCLSNLRFVNRALLQYAADHDGNLLPTKAWDTYASYSIGGTSYRGIRDYLGIISDVANVNAASVKANYLHETVLTCRTMRRLNPNTTVLHRCYSANTFLYQKDPSSAYNNTPLSEIPPLKNAPIKIANVTQPAQMWSFSDASGLKNSSEYAGSYDSSAYKQYLLFPHNGRNHFVFMDGHVEGLTPEEFDIRAAKDSFWGKVP